MVFEKTVENPLDCKEIKPVHPKGDQSWIFHWKDWCWSWNSNTLATSYKESGHWKRPWCWERLRAGGEGNNRGWDGRMASPTQWTWVWVNSRCWQWTGRPSVLQSTELDTTERLNWTDNDNWFRQKCQWMPKLLSWNFMNKIATQSQSLSLQITY